MKIAVIGANGQLGNDVMSAFARQGDEVYALTHTDVEVASLDSVATTLRTLRPHIVVNTAAMHHVEKCEQAPQEAFAVNAVGARNVAIASRDVRAILVHISTDYVFDGCKRSPYVENDLPQPLNVYGVSKLAGEHCVRSIWEKHFILRTSGLFGKNACRAKGGLNFVDLMLKLAKERPEVRVVDGEIVSPTSTRELARQIVALSPSDCYGLYHATAEGGCSWYMFAREIFSITNAAVTLNVASADEFAAKVPRPKYSVLENRELKARRLNVLKSWQDGVREYLGVDAHSRGSDNQEASLARAS